MSQINIGSPAPSEDYQLDKDESFSAEIPGGRHSASLFSPFARENLTRNESELSEDDVDLQKRLDFLESEAEKTLEAMKNHEETTRSRSASSSAPATTENDESIEPLPQSTTTPPPPLPPPIEDEKTTHQSQEDIPPTSATISPPTNTTSITTLTTVIQSEQQNQQISTDSSDTAVQQQEISYGPEPIVRDRHLDQDHTHPDWNKHKKHIFILSEAGKPIFSRYGEDSLLSPLMGVLQAIVSFVHDQNDTIRTLIAGKHKFVFVLKGPIYLACVTYTSEPVSEIQKQLGYLFDQIISILTSKVTGILQKNPSYDLRGLLGGTDSALCNLIHQMNVNPSFSLGSISCLPLAKTVRAQVGEILSSAKSPNLLFSILIANYQLVQLVRPRKQMLHASDLLLVMNFVNSSSSIRASETWAPICLPKFNDKYFLYAYIEFIASDLCLVMISSKNDEFFMLSECKEKVVSGLLNVGAFEPILKAIKNPGYSALDSVQGTIPDVRHFIYKTVNLSQFTCPSFGPPYDTEKEQKRLLRQYQHIRARVFEGDTAPHKIHFHATETEAILGWVSREFEMLTTFAPFVSKETAIKACNSIKRWLKKEEENLFVLSGPVW